MNGGVCRSRFFGFPMGHPVETFVPFATIFHLPQLSHDAPSEKQERSWRGFHR
jgi:hypothetical protein